MNLGDMELSEKVTHIRTQSVWAHVYEVSRAFQFIGTEGKMATARAGEKNRSFCLIMGY